MTIVYPDYTNSILNVSNSILAYYNAPPHHPTHPVVDEYLQQHQPNHIIYVLLDGFGVNILEEHLPKTAVLRQSMKQPISSVYPPTTVAATTSVLTGLTPLETGHIGWVQYFQKEDKNVVVFQNTDFFTDEPLPQNMRETYLSHIELYDQIRKASPNVQTNEFFPSFREGGSTSIDEAIERVLLSTHNSDQSFNYVYWTEPDISQHQHGIHHPKVRDVVLSLNQSVESLLQHVTDDTVVVLIADHGLVDVTPLPIPDYPDLAALLRQQPTIEPRTTTWFVHPGKEREFQTIFTQQFSDSFLLFSREEFLESGLLGQGKRHSIYDQTIGEFVSISISEYMFAYDYEPTHKAHHAGLTSGEMLVPLVLFTKKEVK